MTKHIPEILKEINDNPKNLNEYINNYAIKMLLQYAFSPNAKLLLPDGSPPYKKDAAPIGMTPANFYQHIKKLYVFLRKDLSAVRREQLFIQMLEGIHESEAEILIAVKDQCLTKLYPNITAKLVASHGIITDTASGTTSGTAPQTQTKKRRGRPPKQKAEQKKDKQPNTIVVKIDDNLNIADNLNG